MYIVCVYRIMSRHCIVDYCLHCQAALHMYAHCTHCSVSHNDHTLRCMVYACIFALHYIQVHWTASMCLYIQCSGLHVLACIFCTQSMLFDHKKDIWIISDKIIPGLQYNVGVSNRTSSSDCCNLSSSYRISFCRVLTNVEKYLVLEHTEQREIELCSIIFNHIFVSP